MNRRLFLMSVSGGGLAIAAGASAFALTRSPTRAIQPWEEAGLSRNDARRFVVEHAILAPNPHNRQPWVVELLSDGDMILWCDLDRRLPETDPFDRQIVIGLGAFVELAAIAASALGFRLVVAPFPEGEPRPRLDQRPIARLSLQRDPGLMVDPLFAHIRTRRSVKRPFDMTRSVPDVEADALARLSGQRGTVSLVTASDPVAKLRALTFDAWMIEATTSRTYMESVRLMRIGKGEIEANPDGISLGGPLLDSLALLGELTRDKIADPSSSAFQQGQQMYRTMLEATTAYLTIVTGGETRLDELNAGRLYARVGLTAASLGLSMQPVSQALQEFPEMAAKKAEVEDLLGVAAPRRLQMLARIGYGPAVPPSPRWAAATRIRSA